MAQATDDLVLRMTRRFDAEPERVFVAWTDSHQFGQWFGPTGMTIVSCELDARVGGTWRLVSEFKRAGSDRPGPARFNSSGTYLEVEPHSRLVFTWALHEHADFASPRANETVVTVQLRPVEGRTELVLTQSENKDIRMSGRLSAWKDSFEKLDALVRRAA